MEDKGDLHAQNCDFLSGPGLGSDQGAPYRETSAHHGTSVFGINIVGNLESEIFVGSDMARVPSLRNGTVLIRRSISV